MGEPEIWYFHIKKFLEKRGFQLIGDPKIVSEMDVDIDVRHLEFERIIARYDDRPILEQRFLDYDDIKLSEQATDNEDNWKILCSYVCKNNMSVKMGLDNGK